MPHLPNHDEFKDVGQDKGHHDVTEKYDSTYGHYADEKPAIGTPKDHRQIPEPFTIKGS